MSPSLLVASGVVCVLALATWRIGGSILSADAAEAPAVETTLSTARQTDSRQGVWPRAEHGNAVAPFETPIDRKTAFALAIESLEAEPDATQRATQLERLAAGLSRDALPDALRFLQKQDSSKLSRSLFVRLLRQWVENDLRTAAAWVASESQGEMGEAAIKVVAIFWANQSLSDAFSWVRQLPDGAARDGGLTSLGYELARIDPVKALAVAMELPANYVREDLIKHAATQLAATDPDVAAWWANQIADGASRQRVLGDIASIWGESDPVAAATFVVKALTPGKVQDDAVVGIVQRWAQQKPEAAAAWVASFAAGPLRDTSLGNVVQLWADQDLEGAGRWINSLASGSGRDAAVVAYVSKISVISPQTAQQWVETISDETVRRGQSEMVALR